MRALTIAGATAALLLSCGGASPAADAGRTIEIEMKEFAFTPTTLTVRPGERITLRLRNSGALEHEFMAGTGPMAGKGYEHDWLGIAKVGGTGGAHAADHAGEGVRVAARGSATLTLLVPPQVGSFEFGCFIAGHHESGMRGTLVVDGGVPPNAVPNLRTGEPASPPAHGPAGATGSPHPGGDMEEEGH